MTFDFCKAQPSSWIPIWYQGFNWSHSPKYNIDDCDEWLVRDMNENDEHFVPLFGIDNQGCYSYHYLLFD